MGLFFKNHMIPHPYVTDEQGQQIACIHLHGSPLASREKILSLIKTPIGFIFGAFVGTVALSRCPCSH